MMKLWLQATFGSTKFTPTPTPGPHLGFATWQRTEGGQLSGGLYACMVDMLPAAWHAWVGLG